MVERIGGQREERVSEEDDSLIMELVDLLDIKKKDQTEMTNGKVKARSALHSPKSKDIRLLPKPSDNCVPAEVRRLVLRKTKSTKLVLRCRLTQSTGVSPLLHSRHISKLSKLPPEFSFVSKPV